MQHAFSRSNLAFRDTPGFRCGFYQHLANRGTGCAQEILAGGTNTHAPARNLHTQRVREIQHQTINRRHYSIREINALEQQRAAKEQQFNSEFSTYQSQVQMNILTPEARAQKEQQLGQIQNEYMMLQQQYQQTGMQAEMELQQLYTREQADGDREVHVLAPCAREGIYSDHLTA